MNVKQYYKYKNRNRNYLIRKGKRGGYFILRNKKKIYITSIIKNQKGGNNIPKSFKIYASIDNKWENIKERENRQSNIIGLPLFKDCNDVNEHYKFMSNLASKNKWFFSNKQTGKKRYYGKCFVWNEKQNSWNKLKKYKISDVMESWLTETLSTECLMALLIFQFLKLYRIYGKKIDLIVKDIHCENCDKNAFTTTSSINLDGESLFKFYDEICIPPQQNIIETVNLIQNIDRQFGYIRSNFGYLPMSKIGSSKYLTTSSQGHNIIISCHQGKTHLGVYGFMSIYEPDPEIDPEKNLGKFILLDNSEKIEKWLFKGLSRSIKSLEQSQKENGNKIPINYKILIDNNNQPKLYNYKDWYGGSHFYNISYKLPKNFT